MNLRTEWFNHVAAVHKKALRKNKTATRRESMKLASETWPKLKAKLIRKKERAEKTHKKETKTSEEKQ